MKKLIFLSFIVSLCGCDNTHKVNEADDYWCNKFDYEGHSYIRFSEGNPIKIMHVNIVHDPDCKCIFRKKVIESNIVSPIKK